MAPRFYVPGVYASGDLVTLPDEEAQHLTRVLRLGRGDLLRVFNGTGAEFNASIDEVSRGGVHVTIGAAAASAPEPRVAVTLVQAVLKGDKMDDVVRDAVMLGAAAIQPIVSRRCDVTIASLQRGGRRERWMRVAVSAAKQCGRAVIPHIGEIGTFEMLPDALLSLRIPSPAIVFVEPSAATDAVALRDLDLVPPHDASIVIGPEGGWERGELDLVSRAAHRVTLGGRTLRADAMALVALSALFTHWNEL